MFTEPAGGWSGTVHESARLTASDASKSGGLTGFAIDGRTVVAGTYNQTGSPGEAYVFTEPARGWSGNLQESARLVASGGADGDGFGTSVAVSGQTIAVSAPDADSSPQRPGGGRVYVFTQPAQGWSGTLHQSATLSASSTQARLNGESLAVAGDNVVAAAAAPAAVWSAYVFTKPVGGWSGSLHESAVLTTSDGASFQGSNSLAASDRTIVAGGGVAYVFTEPAGGWANATETAKLTSGQGSSAPSVAISGQTVVGNGGVFVEPAGGWSSSAQPTASLGVTGPGGPIQFASAAMSDGVAVAGAPQVTVGSNQNQGAAYVFTEPASGWSDETEVAKLVASDGQANDNFGAFVAIAGDTVVVGRQGRLATALYVFTEPPGGWSGTLHESARLTVAGPGAGDYMNSLAASGDTIVVGSSVGNGYGGAVYVFTKPASGWSGTIPQSATLTDPDTSSSCARPTAVAIDGSTVVAGGSYCSPGDAYVFSEPAAGWTGTIQPSATLLAPSTISVDSVAVLGSSVAVAGETGDTPVDPVVFNEPASGWSGTVQPAASLKVAPVDPIAYTERVVGSGDEIAVFVIREDQYCGFLPPCPATLYGFSQPLGGWKGTIAGASTGAGTVGPFAIAGRTIATGGLNAIDLLTITPGSPSARSVSLSGLTIGRPRLRFTLDAGQNAAPIRSFRLSLPRGLRFIPHRTGYTSGVSISAPAQRVRLRPDTLTVTLRRPAQSLAIKLIRPAFNEQNSLTAKMRRIRTYNRTHRRKHALTVSMHCAVIDATNHATPLTLKIRIS